ncbi:MAG: hypothetical protein JNL21_32975 [Myxococcales bacterium]|nr:hypothetical protein [Myxococcales bacterium]
MADRDPAFHLEAFIDSLIVELDNVQNRLAVKGLSRPLTYTVEDMSMDLQVFPDFDGRRVRFRTAKPGETGFSKISLQLGSITDRQIRETTRGPVTADDVPLEAIEGMDDETKSDLRAIGVTSVKDLETVQRKNVDLKSVSRKGTDYATLANLINKARRRTAPPQITKAQTSTVGGRPALAFEGRNLVVRDEPPFPLVRVDGRPAAVHEASAERLVVVPQAALAPRSRFQIALDPFAVLNFEMNSRGV